jgi:hypothetical protein
LSLARSFSRQNLRPERFIVFVEHKIMTL